MISSKIRSNFKWKNLQIAYMCDTNGNTEIKFNYKSLTGIETIKNRIRTVNIMAEYYLFHSLRDKYYNFKNTIYSKALQNYIRITNLYCNDKFICLLFIIMKNFNYKCNFII